MHILLLSQYFPPETGSAAAKMAELAGYLMGQGHQVSVVSQVPCYPQGVVYPGYQGAWFRRELADGLRITRTWSYASPERERFRPRFWNYASFMGTALAGILAGPRPDIMLVYSPPLSLGATAMAAGKLWRRPFVFWVNDLWPRAALFLRFMTNGRAYRLACALERATYRQAARIFVYSRRMLEEVVADGAAREKLECHPLWIDTEVFRPDPARAAQVRRQHGWGEKFVVLYGGNLGMAQGLDTFLEAARLLQKQRELHLALVGSGVEKERLRQYAQNHGLDNVEFIGHQPKEQVCAYFSAADVLFAALKEAPHRVGTVPEKILAYMACGRPVLLAAQEGAATDLLQEHRCGLAAPPDHPEALANAIMCLYRDRRQTQEMGDRGLAAAGSHFALPHILRGMEASLRDIASAARHEGPLPRRGQECR